MQTTEKENHAYQNAKAWAGSIAEMVLALQCDYDRLEELRGSDELGDDEKEELDDLEAEATIDGDKMADADEAAQRIQEAPLSVQVRSGWTTPGTPFEAEDFEILLSTGGPALRIRGELGAGNEPHRAWLEYQDWGTPWTEYHGDGCSQESLLAFCLEFYFGS
jgi:hypothetical protein